MVRLKILDWVRNFPPTLFDEYMYRGHTHTDNYAMLDQAQENECVYVRLNLLVVWNTEAVANT